MKTIRLEKIPRGGLADRFEDWFTVSYAPERYLSIRSRRVHKVRYAESVINPTTKTVERVTVRFWCKGIGHVTDENSKKHKGQFIGKNQSEAGTLTECVACCIAAFSHKCKPKKRKYEAAIKTN